MKKSFLIIGIFIFIVNIASATYIQVSLEYSNDTFKFNHTNKFENNIPGGMKGPSDNRYDVYDIKNNLIFQEFIIVPGYTVIENFDKKDKKVHIIDPEIKSIFLNIPYDPKVRNLLVYNMFDEILLDIDLMKYNRCNLNDICDDNENGIVCMEDCSSSEKDGICQNFEDGTCNNDPDCEKKDPDCILLNLNNRETDKDLVEDKEIQDKEIINNANQVNNAKISIFIGILIIVGLVIFGAIKRKVNVE